LAPRFIAVTFYTEGSPWDAGESLVDEERLFRVAVEPYVDEVWSFCPRSMAGRWRGAEGYFRDYSEWLERHPLRQELRRYNRQWARLGFMAGKPFLLKSLLHDNSILPGDVLLYRDVNVRKYPAYYRTPAEWRNVSFRILETLGCDVFVPAGFRLETDAKAFLVRRYLNESMGINRGVWAGLILCRKSQQSIAFVDEWMTMCDDLDNLSPLPNPNPYAGAVWHAPEQAVLGVLAWKWKREGQLPTVWPLYAEGDRSFDAQIFTRPSRPPNACLRWLYSFYLSLPTALQMLVLSILKWLAMLKKWLAMLKNRFRAP